MTDQNIDPGSVPERSASARGSQGWSSTDEPGSTSIYPDLGTAEADVSDSALGLDDTTPVPATSGQVDSDVALASDPEDIPRSPTAGSPTAGSTVAHAPQRGDDGTASGAAEHAAGAVREVAGHAADNAAEVKETAVERGADVAEVARDELGQLTDEARRHARDLWSQASGQVRQQADAGRHQLADLLHSVASELGEMASKSTQDGPVTALAKQASARCGDWSHRLANSEPAELVGEIRRFARRRPFVFLGGAALAGVLVGRLGRGLMAGEGTDRSSASAGHRYTSTSAGHEVTTAPPVGLSDAPAFDTSGGWR